MKLVKGFVDILILTSGYQSSGRIAHWDPLNIKKAFQWAFFFENVSTPFALLYHLVCCGWSQNAAFRIYTLSSLISYALFLFSFETRI